ncbi:MAG: hypothetical protein E7342_04140 [Clostridiales bacterium]|nr:hypothetical protein [Clostridiales bacterium]
MNSLGRDEKNTKKERLFTKETFGMIFILFSVLSLVCLITRDKVFAGIGLAVSQFLFGVFGYFSYILSIFFIVLGIDMVIQKKVFPKLKVTFFIASSLVLAFLLIHLITANSFDYVNYKDYLGACYDAGKDLFTTTGGGLLLGLVAYWMVNLFTLVGTYAIVSILLVGSLYFTVKNCILVKNQNRIKKQKNVQTKKEEEEIDIKEEPAQRLYIGKNDFALKGRKETFDIKISDNEGLNIASTTKPYEKSYKDDMSRKLDYIKTPTKIDVQKTLNNMGNGSNFSTPIPQTGSSFGQGTVVSKPVERREYTTPTTQNTKLPPLFSHEEKIDTLQSRAEEYNKYAELEESNLSNNAQNESVEKETFVQPSITFEEEPKVTESFSYEETIKEEPKVEEPTIEEPKFEEPPVSNVPPIRNSRRNFSLFDDEEIKDLKEEGKTETAEEDLLSSRKSRNSNVSNQQPKVEEQKVEKVVPPINRVYNKPPVYLLQNYKTTVDKDTENHQTNCEIIERTLSEFNINAEVTGFIQGPTITRYEVKMPAGVSVKKILGVDDDIQMRLAARDGIRIQAPIPGKDRVGIEVANNVKQMVGLKEVLESDVFANAKPNTLTFALGKDVVGDVKCDDLAKGPHYLIAGSTGAGKSVCLNVLLVSLIYKYSPEELKLILVDPKTVEFRAYEHLPHLLMDEIITDHRKVIAVLNWAYEEMERRNATFKESGHSVVDIDTYNQYVASDTIPKMPRIVIVIDELADLMSTCKKDLETCIVRLAQKARSAGIHLVLATQRPSVDVITGTIKTNLPSRIAFKTMSTYDSQTIMNEAGAEKLLGKGDMLYKNATMPACERYQGAFVSAAEVDSVVEYIIKNNVAYFDNELAEFLENTVNPKVEEKEGSSQGDNGEDEALFVDALRLCIQQNGASISSLRRRFSIGYAKAGNLIDKMERLGYISHFEGSKTRQVFITKEQFEEKYGDL